MRLLNFPKSQNWRLSESEASGYCAAACALFRKKACLDTQDRGKRSGMLDRTSSFTRKRPQICPQLLQGAENQSPINHRSGLKIRCSARGLWVRVPLPAADLCGTFLC